jgi:lysozyme
MRLSSEGKAVLEYFEGRLNEAYPDPATGGAPWTIGVGHTGSDVFKHLMWSDEKIDEALEADLVKFEAGVSKLVNGKHITQGQFDALVLFAFNVGIGALAGSTLLRKFVAGDLKGTAGEFLRWDKGAGKSMLGLRRRRTAEVALFNGSTGAAARQIAAMVK